MSTKAPAVINVPPSSTTVSVKIIDVAYIARLSANALYQPPIPGIDYLQPAPSFSFLIEHASGQRVFFDLGIPTDISILGPEIEARLKEKGHQIRVENPPVETLEKHGISRNEIGAVIWSHTHWDHKGDMKKFPVSTDLVVGPGVRKCFVDGDGNSGLGGINPRDIEGRKLREITFEGPSLLNIGQFRAFDYFADGSFYLLDAPGHSVGHLCALARTTTSPDTFVFLGGDATHHCAEYRPSKYVPMPDSVTPNPVDINSKMPYCPGSWFGDINVQRGRDPKGPLYKPGFAADMDETQRTIEKMQEYDGEDSVFIIIAHDASVNKAAGVPFFPESVNDWQKRGLGRDLKWAWIGDIKAALQGKW